MSSSSTTGTPVTATPDLAREVAAEELAAHPRRDRRGGLRGRHWQQAHDLLLQVALDEDYADFLTLPAYEQLAG